MNERNLLKKIIPVKLRQYFRPLRRKVQFAARLRSPLSIKKLVKHYCIGQGIEIGPGKKPYCDKKNTLFIDKHTNNKDGAHKADLVIDATQLPFKDDFFDFLFSSHCLEHFANTLKTLYEWKRVIKPGGIVFLVLPHGNRTFDKYRNKTDLNHHIRDYENNIGQHDHSHIDEIKLGWSKLEDFEEQKDQFEKAWGFSMWDFESRMKHDVIHYHVWTQNEMIEVLKYIDLSILCVFDKVPERHDSFLIIAQKKQSEDK